MIDLSVILLHEGMVNKEQKSVTTSLTMIDVHDFARSCKTYGITKVYISHPSPTLLKLASTLKHHWEEGFGSTYNPDRKDAIENVCLVSHIDEAISDIEARRKVIPTLIATSAKKGLGRISYTAMKERIKDEKPYLLMFGTGWGMGGELLARAEILLEPICGPTEYNHLSVRSACAIILDRLLG